MTQPASDALIADLSDRNSINRLFPYTEHVDALIARIKQDAETIKRMKAILNAILESEHVRDEDDDMLHSCGCDYCMSILAARKEAGQ